MINLWRSLNLETERDFCKQALGAIHEGRSNRGSDCYGCFWRCAGAIQSAGISRVVFGVRDDNVGAAGSLHDLVRDRSLGTEIQVIPEVLALQSIARLKEFFEQKR